MEAESEVKVEAEDETAVEAVPHCPVCASEMVSSNGVKMVCVACGFEGAKCG